MLSHPSVNHLSTDGIPNLKENKDDKPKCNLAIMESVDLKLQMKVLDEISRRSLLATNTKRVPLVATSRHSALSALDHRIIIVIHIY